jgi:NAD+ synthase
MKCDILNIRVIFRLGIIYLHYFTSFFYMIIEYKLDIDCANIVEKVSKFIKNSVQDSSLQGAVVALSGGLDSAVTLSLTVEALGSKNVTVLHLPERDITPNQDTLDVMLHCKSLNLTCNTIDITSILHVMQKKLPKITSNHRTCFGNLKARVRMTLIYYFANAYNKMVIGTSNKTEILTGFFTKYGDGGVDLIPLGDLYKTQIRQLARYLKIPRNIIDKPPSPGFFPGQTDEGELGLDYSTIDKVLYGWEKGFSSEEISKSLDLNMETIGSLEKRVNINEHKRHFPLILRLSN